MPKMQTMIGVNLNELFPITKVARGFNALVNRISSGELEKAIVMKNNEPEVVIMNIDEFTKLKQKEEALELMQINAIVQRRGRKRKPDTMSMDEMFAKAEAIRK